MSTHDAPAAAATPARAQPTRNNFDGLRLLGALLVVYGHQPIVEIWTDGLRLVMFFSISGFLVAGSWTSDPHAGRFLARRFLRVWPAFAALIVVCAMVSWLVAAGDFPELTRTVSVFYLSNLWLPYFDISVFPGANPMMNQALWMLPYEIDLYLAFALVALAGRRVRIAVAVVLIALATQSPQTIRAAGGLFACWSPYFAGFFAFGVLLRDVPALRRDAFAAACVGLGLVALALGERSAGLVLVVPSAAVWVGLRSWPVLRSAARFGDLSLGIFLWSYPIQQLTRVWLGADLPVVVQFAVVIAQVIPIAWLSHRFIELPALRLKPRKAAAPPRSGYSTNVPATPTPIRIGAV